MSGSAQTENVKSAPSQHFEFEQFQRSKIIFESRFPKKSYIITILKKIVRLLYQYLKKNPFVFSNLARPMVGGTQQS